MKLAADFLVEIGTEELPAKGLSDLAHAFEEKITAQLKEVQLNYESVQSFVTPRRLSLIVKQLAVQPPVQNIERRGPAVSDAFDASGVPTPAALGFAKSCGVAVEALEQQQIGKAVHLVFKKQQPAQKTIELLPQMIKNALDRLPTPRSMRWGGHEHAFLRPIRWITMLLGNEVVPATLFGVVAGRETYGHRFHQPQAILLNQPSDYVPMLETQGFVIPDFERRKDQIREQVMKASKGKGTPKIDEDLLTEVTGLVEWPVALVGHFSDTFLEVPDEALMVAMKNHQRYFPMVDEKGALLPCFVVVSNLSSQNPQLVISGNERVLGARLSDARFFYHQDAKQNFLERLPKLEKMIFQKALGNLMQKTERMEVLAGWIASVLHADKEKAMIAATLSKLDLTTEMVNEFPELQGVMGYYYAQLAGFEESVASAVKSHYQPRFSGDAIPDNLLGAIVALADKVDTLVGIFGIGQIPTGEKDPFALRRAALGVLRILVEQSLPLDLYALLSESLRIYGDKLKTEGLVDTLFDFMMERLRAWYLEQGVSASVFAAVLACRPTCPFEFHQRIQAVQKFQSLPLAKALVTMKKRVDHLLKKQEMILTKHWDPALFEHEAERELARMIQEKSIQMEALRQMQAYEAMLSTLIELQPAMDQFFDQVMVMVDDEKIRQNRLGLMGQLQELFLEVADISLVFQN